MPRPFHGPFKMTEEGICPRASPGFMEGKNTGGSSTVVEEDREGKWAQGSVAIQQHLSRIGKTNSFGGISRTHPLLSNSPLENVNHWNSESDAIPLKSKNPQSAKKSTTGGKLKKINPEISQKQLKECNLSENSQKRSKKDKKQEKLQFCSNPQNKDFKKSSMKTGFNVNNHLKLTLNHSLPDGSPVDRQAGSLSPHWPSADGDFCKDRNGPQSTSPSAPECTNRRNLFSSNWNAKCGNNNMEENLTKESDLSEDENVNDTLISYFKKMDLKLKQEVKDDFEEPFSEQPSQVFSYPDFLPPPFNNLDLHKLAFSKSDNWKLALDPIESSTEQLINRLLEMERIQYMTIQKERPKIPINCSTLGP